MTNSFVDKVSEQISDILPLGQKEIPVFQVCKRVFSYVKISIDFPQKQD